MPIPNFFFNTTSDIFAVETLEISHPSFSQTYRIVRNVVGGWTAKTEESGTPTRTFTYYPCEITYPSSSDDLDFIIRISFGDLGEIIPDELDRVFSDGLIAVKPQLKYRIYQSDNTDAPIFYDVNPLEISGLSFNSKGVTFEASPPGRNYTSIGMRYTVDNFPSLGGFS
jgi:hypothetical protein